MATLAAFISSAIEKVSHDEVYANMEFATPEEARTNFTAALLFELGLGPKPVAAHAPESAPKAVEKKKRASKKTQEVAVAEAAVAVLEQVKEAPKEVEALAEQMGQLALDEQPKAKKARKTKAADPEPKPVGDAIAWDAMGTPVAYAQPPAVPEKKVRKTKAAAPEPAANAGAAPEKKKPGPKPKASKPEGPVNVEKLTPTHKKHLKAIAEELKVESRDKEFLAYANGMSAEEWGAASLDDHIRKFLTPHPPPLADPPVEFLHVEFKGVDYLVDPTTKFVYADSDSETVRARDHLGVVGVLQFADMELPEEDE